MTTKLSDATWAGGCAGAPAAGSTASSWRCRRRPAPRVSDATLPPISLYHQTYMSAMRKRRSLTRSPSSPTRSAPRPSPPNARHHPVHERYDPLSEPGSRTGRGAVLTSQEACMQRRFHPGKSTDQPHSDERNVWPATCAASSSGFFSSTYLRPRRVPR